MERLQALYTMHELLVALADSPIKKHIAIETEPNTSLSTEKNIIKIKHELDDEVIKKIVPIIEKHNLNIKKIENALVIH